MRYLTGSVAATFALVFLAGSWSNLLAQQTKPPRPGSPAAAANAQPAAGQPAAGPVRPAAPQPKAAPVTQTSGQQRPKPDGPAAQNAPAVQNAPPDVISKELEDLLRQWELKSSQIKSLRGTHQRIVYNKVFAEEKIAEGKFYVETPDKGRIDLVGIKPKPNEKSKRLDKNGVAFTVVADRAEKWICTGNELVMVNDEAKTYEVAPLPEHLKGTNIINSPLPFLFGMKAADAKRRFKMILHESSTDKVAILVVQPKLASDLENYVEAFIKLERVNYLPTAVKMIDPSGSMETVYVFENVKINGARGSWIDIFRNDKDPFKPDLLGWGYKRVVRPVEEAELPARNDKIDPRLIPQNPRPTNPSGVKDASRVIPSGANTGGTKIK